MPIILIVDDDPENLESLKLALGDENPDWIILTASSEEDGEKQLRDQWHKKDPVGLVLTDLVMDSVSSGMNILQKARQIDPLVMTLLFTANESRLDRYKAFEYGAFDVVEKNIRGISAVKEIMVKSRAALRYREWSQKINFLRRYFDPKVFEVIEREPSLLAVSHKLVTIVFWDIRGFSRLCESLKAHPTLISGFLQEYCEMGAETVFDHSGVLDKFIGDGIMALFGVLNHKDDGGTTDAVRAVESAIAMRSKFQPIVDKWVEEWNLYVPDKIDIKLGCGIHTGEVLVGNVGTSVRDQFTALGTHVNFASRIESRSDLGQIVLSQSTAARVKDSIPLESFGEISDIKNIPGTFPLYKVKEIERPLVV